MLLPAHDTEVCFTRFFSNGFTTMAVINPPERKLAKRISVQWPTRPEKDGSGLERHFTEKMDGFLDRSLIWKFRVV